MIDTRHHALRLLAACVVAVLAAATLHAQESNVAPFGFATQSSDFDATFIADLALDGLLDNFTHTNVGQDLTLDPVHWWEVDLGDVYDIGSVIAFNRTSCCASRLRDITIIIKDGGEEVFRSPLLNPENVQGGMLEQVGPPFLAIDLVYFTGATVEGDMVRIERIPDPDLSGTGGAGNNDEPYVLQLGEVEVHEVPDDCPEEGDSFCDALTMTEAPAGNGLGLYTFEAEGSDDSGDFPLYTFRARLEGNDDVLLVAGPQEDAVASFLLTEAGNWTVDVFVDDSIPCHDTAADATCSETVEVTAACPAEGDTSCDTLDIVPAREGGAGLHTFTAVGVDDSGDTVTYELTLDDGVNAPRVIGPQAEPIFEAVLGAGQWDIELRVDDDPFCDDEAADAVCRAELVLEERNLARDRVATQSSDYNATFVAGLAVNGDPGDFTHTVAGAHLPGPAWWEVDLEDEYAIGEIVIYNRGGGCCQARLRDLGVTILDADREVVFDLLGYDALEDIETLELGDGENEDLLNGENILGAMTLDVGPPTLTLRFGESPDGPEDDSVLELDREAVVGRFVRIWRFPDEDLSGTFGGGNADEGTVLSLGEVEVFEATETGPPAGSFRRGDADGNGAVEITDPIFNLTFQFAADAQPLCLDALDVDDNGAIEITDPILNLSFQFLGQGQIPPPGAAQCGADPTEDSLGCEAYPLEACGG